MTHIKIFNALLTIPFALAVGCSPDVSVEPPADMATAPSVMTSTTTKTTALKFTNCTPTTTAFEVMTPLPSTKIELLGTNAQKTCQGQASINQPGGVVCSIATDSLLTEILGSAAVYLRVNENFWLPTVIAGNSASSASVATVQGQMDITTNGTSALNSVGEVRASEFVTEEQAKKISTEKVTTILLKSPAVSIKEVRFRLPFTCLTTRSIAMPMQDIPNWTINSIVVSNSPNF